MNLRRRPKIERVREVKDSLPEYVARCFGEEIVALRESILKAIVLIESGHPDAGAKCLRDALEVER